MKPLKFKEAHIELNKPASMSAEECGGLWVHRSNQGESISVWTATFWQRVKFLFHGRIWIGVLSGYSQPPIWLDCTKTIFIKPKKK